MRKNQPANQQYAEFCKRSFACQYIKKKSCRYKHSQSDIRLAKAYERMLQYGDAIIYLKDKSPCVLLAEQMPVKVKAEKLEEFRFYEVKVGEYIDGKLEVEVVKDMGPFGELESERVILQRHYDALFDPQRKCDNTERGIVQVDDRQRKSINGKHKCLMKSVNQVQDHRLIDGAEVIYKYINKVTAQVSSIHYKKFNFYGILRLNPNYSLDFIPRNIKIDEMTVQNGPKKIFDQLGLEAFMSNYSMLVKRPALKRLGPDNKQLPIDLEDINSKLQQTMIKGRFIEWPEQWRQPLIVLEEQFLENCIKSHKRAVIEELELLKGASKKEQSQARDIVKKYSSQTAYANLKKHRRNLKELEIFSIDSSSARCLDDAFSIQKVVDKTEEDKKGHKDDNQDNPDDKDNKESKDNKDKEDKKDDIDDKKKQKVAEPSSFWDVGIHISDVASIIKEGDKLDKECNRRDSTIYVKDYHLTMLPKCLSEGLLSLKEGEDRVMYSLFFKMNDKGLINYNSISTLRTFGRITKNYSHRQVNSILSNPPAPSQKNLNSLIPVLNTLVHTRIQHRQADYFKPDSPAQELVQQLMITTSEIISYLLDKNLLKVKSYREKIEGQLTKMMESQVQNIEEIQKKRKQLKELSKKIDDEFALKRKLEREMEREIEKETKKEKKRVREELQAEGKKLREQMQGDKKAGDKETKSQKQGQQSEKETDDELQNMLHQATPEEQQAKVDQQKVEELKKIEQSKEKQQADKDIQKLLQDIKQKPAQPEKKKIQQQQSSSSDEQLSKDEIQAKEARAKRAQFYMSKIFDLLGGVIVQWRTRDQVREMFRKIIASRPSKLFKQFFERMLVMNNQHFKYLVEDHGPRKKLTEDKPKKQAKKPQEPKKKQQNKQLKNATDLPKQTKIEQKEKNIKQIKLQDNKDSKDSDKIEEKKDSEQKKEPQGETEKKHEPLVKTTSQPEQNKEPKLSKKEISKKQSKKNKDGKKEKKFKNKDSIHEEYTDQQSKAPQQQKSQLKTNQQGNNSKQQKKKSKPKKEKKSIEQNRQDLQSQSKPVIQPSQSKIQLKTQIIPETNKEQKVVQKPQQSRTQKDYEPGDSNQSKVEQTNIKIPEVSTSSQPNKQEKPRESKPKQQKVPTLRSQLKKLNKAKAQQLKDLVKKIRQNFKQEFKNKNAELLSNIELDTKQQEKLEDQIVDELKGSQPLIIIAEDLDKSEFITLPKNHLAMIKLYYQICKAFKIKNKKKRPSSEDILNLFKSIKIQPFNQEQAEKTNRQSIKLFEQTPKQKRLSWSNPIREYYSLKCLRFIKDYEWILQGELQIEDLIDNYKDIKSIEKDLKQILKWNLKRIQAGENNSKTKEANRQIEKLNFYDLTRKKPGQIHRFLLINDGKVYHPILGEVYLTNYTEKMKPFEEINGKVVIVSDFPINMKIQAVP